MRTDIKIKASDKAQLCGYIWKNEDTPVTKIVIIAHGMAEHIERYERFANHLVEAGFMVIGYNQRGHKDTTPKEEIGYMGDNVNNFDILVSDYHDVVMYAAGQYPNALRYGFGHSMGSFVLNRYIQLYNDLNKVVLCGTGKNPTLVLNFGMCFVSFLSIFKGKRYSSKLVDDMSFGAYNKKFKPNRTEFDWLNTVDEEVDKYIEDEYCGGIFSLKYFHDFFKGMKKINKNQKHISNDLPILLISGGADPVGNMGKGPTQVYNNLKKNNCKAELKLIPGERHEILLEKSSEQTHQFIINWYNKQ